MSKQKQIEEMARLLCGQVKSCTECAVHKPCLMMNCATILIEKGYRKAPEVAREIFEEIETFLYLNVLHGDVFTGRYFSEELETDIAELKKKYTEEGE